MSPKPNLKKAVPFFMVREIDHSLDFYVKGLGFEVKFDWKPNGRIEWCWIERDGISFMLQEYRKDWVPTEKPDVGISICVVCEDALELYREFSRKGINASEPLVGNNMWVTCLTDPDGYRIDFESATDVPEETKYTDWHPAEKS